MSTSALLARRMLRGGGARDLRTHGLAVLATAVAVTVMLLTLGAVTGLADRDGRTAWLRPAASDDAGAVQTTSTTYVDGKPLTLVHLAALPGERGGDRALPAPPGMDAFPEPGEVAVSPALRDLLASRPADQRPVGPVTAELGTDGLIGPDQLVAVVGARPGDAALQGPAWSSANTPGDFAGPTEIRDFAGSPAAAESDERGYVQLALVASILLVIPVLTLTGAAARLGASRRADRLARLRLAGASGRTVAGVAVVEAGAIAVTGALAGATAYALLLPLVSRIPVGGSAFTPGQLWVGVLGLLAVTALVAALGIASALVPVRRILRDPLSVAQQHAQSMPLLWRVLAAGAAALAFHQLTRNGDTSSVGVLIAFAAVFGVLAIVGPVVVTLLGRMVVRRAQRRADSARLIAGRRLLDDPRAGWRSVSGLVMASFVAGFLALFSVGGGGVVWGQERELEIAVTAEQAPGALAKARSALADADVEATPVRGDDSGALLFLDAGERAWSTVVVPLPADPAEENRARAAVARAFPGAPTASGGDVENRADQFARDFRAASVVVLLVSFLVAAASTGIVAAAAVLDRRENYRRLWQAGVPLPTLDRARVLESTSPMVVCASLAVFAGLFAAAPITLAGGSVSGTGALLLVLTIALGAAGVHLAIRASRGLLRSAAQS